MRRVHSNRCLGSIKCEFVVSNLIIPCVARRTLACRLCAHHADTRNELFNRGMHESALDALQHYKGNGPVASAALVYVYPPPPPPRPAPPPCPPLCSSPSTYVYTHVHAHACARTPTYSPPKTYPCCSHTRTCALMYPWAQNHTTRALIQCTSFNPGCFGGCSQGADSPSADMSGAQCGAGSATSPAQWRLACVPPE